jgi:hypothetical protein
MHILAHFITVSKHRHHVLVNCIKAGIFWQGLVHDLSKFSFAEFYVGAIYYQKDKSPNVKERETYGYSKAWLHHQGRNKHHFEYWLDYSPIEKKLAPIEMPRKYVIEMFCDRVAASKVYQGKLYTNSSPLNYFLNSKDRIMMHSKTKEELEFLLRVLENDGEKAAFHYIKTVYSKQK